MIDRQRLYELSCMEISLKADELREMRPDTVCIPVARRDLMRAVNCHRDAFPDLVSKHGI